MNYFAITNCRVSTAEQLENNSLNRQQEAVLKCAKELGATIPSDGQWSGNVSSKAGTNIHRKDINEMLEYCKKNKRVRYLIVDEPDRFMRSIKEANYFEVLFEQLGVKIWYASDPDLNTNDMAAKMMQFVKYFAAEGSNEERQRKSVSGGKKAIQEGRLPSGPKAGYLKGKIAGVHEVDPLTGPLLQRALKQIASNLKTPKDALAELVETEFGKRYGKKYKMDKFRKTACEPYYAGIIDLKGKFDLRNENGLHEPLITKEEHQKILRVFTRTPKSQQGHNPDKITSYPLTNSLTCILCDLAQKKYPRFTSCPINNGRKRKTTQFYTRYRCRECSRYLDRDETHESFSDLLDRIVLPYPELKKLKTKLIKTFDAKHYQTKGEIQRLEAVNANIKRSIDEKADAATDPSLKTIRTEILNSIEKLKIELSDNNEKILILNDQHEDDLDDFLAYAFDFISDKGSKFFELSGEDMKRCKQLLFTGKIYVDAEKNVYTSEISSIFRGQESKRDALASQKSNVVRDS